MANVNDLQSAFLGGGDLNDSWSSFYSGNHGLWTPEGPRQTYVASSDLITQFQSGHGWTGSTGFVANDTSDFVVGTQASSLTTSSSATFNIRNTALSLDLTGKQIRVRLKVDDITNLNAVNVWASNDTGFAASYKWFVQGTQGGSNQIISGGTTAGVGWVTIVLNVADAQLVGVPTRTGIVALKFEVSRTAAAGEVTLRVNEIDFVPEPASKYPNGAAVICFDDCQATQWSAAIPILNVKRYRANFFTIIDQVGLSGRLTMNQLLALQSQGHEIHAHAWTDANHGLTFTGLSSGDLEADLRNEKAWLRRNGFNGEGIAYPKGQYGLTTDGVSTESLVRKYYKWARADTGGTNKPSGTYPTGDFYRVAALSSISGFAGGFSPATLTGTGVGSLTAIKNNHGVKIMVFHKVVASPAGTDEISTTDFQSIIDKITSLGMSVITFGELMST